MTTYVRQLTKQEGDARLSEVARKYNYLAPKIAKALEANNNQLCYIYLHEINRKKVRAFESTLDDIKSRNSGARIDIISYCIRPNVYDLMIQCADNNDVRHLTVIEKHFGIEVYNPIKHEFNQMRSPVRPGAWIKLASYQEYVELSRNWIKDSSIYPEIKDALASFINETDFRFIISFDITKEQSNLLEKIQSPGIRLLVEDSSKYGFIIPVAPEEDAEGMMKTLATAFGLEIYSKQEFHSNDRRIRIVDGEWCKQQLRLILQSPPAIPAVESNGVTTNELRQLFIETVLKVEKLLREDIKSGVEIRNITQQQAWEIETAHPMAVRYCASGSITANVLLSYKDKDAENLETIVQGLSKFLNIPIQRTVEEPVFPGQKVSPELAIERVSLLRELITEYNSEISEAAVWADVSPSYVKKSIATIPDALRGADIVLWTEEMWNAGVSGCETFIDKILDQETVDLNINPSVWMWDHIATAIRFPIDIDFQLPDDYKGNIACIYLCQTVRITEDSPYMSSYGRTPLRMEYTEIESSLTRGDIQNRGLRFVFVFRSEQVKIPILRCLPCIYIGDKITNYQAMLIAALKFMHIDIIVKEPVRPARQYRRRAERENRKLPEVHTIYLRRLKHMDKKHVENDGEGEHVKREFSVQWLVGGHWRNQFYKSTGSHKMIYISPYMKGDPSKPFKTPSRSIFKVAR